MRIKHSGPFSGRKQAARFLISPLRDKDAVHGHKRLDMWYTVLDFVRLAWNVAAMVEEG
jgi:hypothetical protein